MAVPCLAAIEVLAKTVLETPHAAAYSNACGTLAARTAVAKHHSCSQARITPDDVIIANGCSGALDLALNSLLDTGTTLLVPQPGFPLYEEIAKSIGANVVRYHLNPKRAWECDMAHLESIMENHPNVRALVINNPSSATGSVFSASHLAEIIEFATTHRIPIVSDEIYGDLTFGSNMFTPIAQMAARAGSLVPVITATGISKQFLLPGWRVGWLTFHDKYVRLINE
jgi:tyrosine aminotransferase